MLTNNTGTDMNFGGVMDTTIGVAGRLHRHRRRHAHRHQHEQLEDRTTAGPSKSRT